MKRGTVLSVPLCWVGSFLLILENPFSASPHPRSPWTKSPAPSAARAQLGGAPGGPALLPSALPPACPGPRLQPGRLAGLAGTRGTERSSIPQMTPAGCRVRGCLSRAGFLPLEPRAAEKESLPLRAPLPSPPLARAPGTVPGTGARPCSASCGASPLPSLCLCLSRPGSCPFSRVCGDGDRPVLSRAGGAQVAGALSARALGAGAGGRGVGLFPAPSGPGRTFLRLWAICCQVSK